MDPRAGLDRCGKTRPPPTGIRSPDRAARSQSLYRLSYPARKSKGQHLFCLLVFTGCSSGQEIVFDGGVIAHCAEVCLVLAAL